MANTEQALDIMHEAGVLVCMALFVVSGALMMLSYGNDGDALPVFGGLTAMLVGATVLLRTPGRFKKWQKRKDAEAMASVDENELYEYEESMLRLR